MKNHSLTISVDELKRARSRIHDPKWKPSADQLKGEADRILASDEPAPVFDSSWYDEDPKRDYAKNYQNFHLYIRKGGRFLRQNVLSLLYTGLIFENEQYFAKAIELSMNVVDGFKFHVKHYDNGMEYSFTAGMFAEVYTVCREMMSDDQHGRFFEQMKACAQAIEESNNEWLNEPSLAAMPYNNHFAFHWYGLMVLGLILDRRDWVDDAIDGPRGFAELLNGACYDNGLCYESSTGYHFATAGSLMQIAELARHCPEVGRDLYHETFANGRNYKQMLDAPLGLLLPSGDYIYLGDCYARRGPLTERHSKCYEIGYAIYGDPAYAWMLNRTGDRNSAAALIYGEEEFSLCRTPDVRSTTWIEHGYTLLTSAENDDYWQGKGYVAVITGDRSGIHHHRDAMSVQIFAGNKRWTDDVESQPTAYHGFSEPIQEIFNRCTIAHNTVVVDQQNHQRLTHPVTVTQFNNLPGCKTVTLCDRDGKVYAGVAMQRSIVVTDDFCLDVFQVSSDEEHTYEWVHHPRSDEPVAFEVPMKPTTIDAELWGQVLRESVIGEVGEQGTSLACKQDDLEFRTDVSAGVRGHLLRTLWPVYSDWSQGGQEMFIYRIHARQVDFVALYQLQTVRPSWRVESRERIFDGKDVRLHIVVTNGNEKRMFSFDTV